MKIPCLICFCLFFKCILPLTAASAFNAAPLSDVYNGERGTSFNDGWKFYLGDATGASAKAFNDAGWRNLSLPHDWSIELSFDKNSSAGGGGGYLDGGIGWYRKSFTLPQAYSGKRITIQFEGIYMNGQVWINGHDLGVRPYGYSSFEYDLTPYINFGTTSNVIAVKANNNQPNSRWYSGSGIYRNVWLTITDPVHVAYCGSFVTTPAVSQSSATISVSTKVQNHSGFVQTVLLVTTIYNQAGTGLVSTKSSAVNITPKDSNTFNYILNISNPQLWSTVNPYLYTVKTQVFVNNSCVDNFVSRLGVRYYSLDANNGFSLNGVNMKLHGVCMHHDLGSLGAAQNYRALERQVEILKSFGCNAIRTSHNPPTPTLLDICDRLGVVVMDEAFDCWRQGKNANDYHLYFDAWAQKDVQDWVRRDRNHPSVIMWSIGNEIPEQGSAAAIPIANNLISWVHSDDTTRPITQAMNSQAVLGDLLNIVGYNYANGGTYDSDHLNHNTWRIMGSETSSAVRTRGIYHLPANQNILTSADMQCSNYDNSVVSWGHSAENSWRFDKERAFVLGQFIWTGFDYIGEPTPYGWPAKSSYFGIVDMAGFPKDIYYFYQSQWTPTPMVHLLPHWNWTTGSSIPVWAYSNCDSVKLMINGKLLGSQHLQIGGAYHMEWNIPFEAGTVKAIAFKNGAIAAMDSIVTAGIAAKIKLTTDRDTIQADGRDLAFIETDIQDINNNFVPDAGNQVSYNITGPGKIAGVDNGNPISIESFKGSTRKAFNGKCLAIVQSTGVEGQILVTATTPAILQNIALGKPSNADSEDVYVLNNIALGKTASSDSAESGNGASNGNDGNTGTRWCAYDRNRNHWWKVDLGINYNLTGSQVMWEHDGHAYQYRIEVSADNITWSTAVDKTTNTNTQQTQTDNFSTSGRYVRITVTGGVNTSNWACFYEFRVFDGTTTKTSNGNTALKGNDGNATTRWSAADALPGHWWKVDLGSSYNINATQVTWENAENAYQYKIETSNDSIIWSMAADKTGNIKAQQLQTDSFNVSARYVRITVTGGVSSSNKASFMEFKVFDGSSTAIVPAMVIINAVNKPWVNIDNNGWLQTRSVSACQGGTVVFRPFTTDSLDSWSWTGPNNFTANSGEIRLGNLQTNQSGTYTATRNSFSYNLKLTVNPVPGITSFVNVNNTGLQQVDSITVIKGDGVLFSPQPSTPVSWTWTGPNGYQAASRAIQLDNVQASQTGTYTVQYMNASGCFASKDVKLAVKNGTGIWNTSIQDGVEIYPNPSISGRFTVIIPDNLVSSDNIIRIYDLCGLKRGEAKIQGSNSEIMDARELGLTGGIYFIKVKGKKMDATKKLIVL